MSMRQTPIPNLVKKISPQCLLTKWVKYTFLCLLYFSQIHIQTYGPIVMHKGSEDVES